MAIAAVVNRREFLKTGAAGGVALVVGFRLSPAAFADQAEDQEKKPPNPFDAWVRITPDNRVTLILSKSEMGQGIMTALPMIHAQFFCEDHGERRHDALAHFRFAQNERDAIVRSNTYSGIKGIGRFLLLVLGVI